MHWRSREKMKRARPDYKRVIAWTPRFCLDCEDWHLWTHVWKPRTGKHVYCEPCYAGMLLKDKRQGKSISDPLYKIVADIYGPVMAKQFQETGLKELVSSLSGEL